MGEASGVGPTPGRPDLGPLILERNFLAVEWDPASGIRSARSAVSGFLKYVQHRDLPTDEDKGRRLDGVLRYVAYRDRTGSSQRMFGPLGPAGDRERKQLEDHVAKSVEGLKPRLAKGSDGLFHDYNRAVYRLVISPEFAPGLELSRVTTAALRKLETEVGGIGPWLAVEHRNTAHHHIHLVIAARRRLEDGRYREVRITRARLERMKAAAVLEVSRQRSLEHLPQRIVRKALRVERDLAMPTVVRRCRSQRHAIVHRGLRWRVAPRFVVAGAALRLRSVATRYRHQMERDLEEQQRRLERGSMAR
jgi:hypothetical protein